jgi:dihydroorotate dehydrogenase (fumarate)
MADTTVTYLGLELPHPFIAGASPLSETLDGACRLEEGGAAAIVLRSLYAEQVAAESMATHLAMHAHAESYGEATSYLPEPEELPLGPDEYLGHLSRVKARVTVPVIASLNGERVGPWVDHARLLEEAGADAIELNIYRVVTDPFVDGATVENEAVEIVREVRARTRLPIAVKLSPFYSSIAHLAGRLRDAGADGLVLFNRFFEPDIDAENLAVEPHLVASSSAELLLRLRWLAILSGVVEGADLAVTGGVHTPSDAVKSVMCGAHGVQLVSTLLVNGPGRTNALRAEFGAWLDEHEYASVNQMRGNMNLARCPDPSAHTRSQYIRTLRSWSV